MAKGDHIYIKGNYGAIPFQHHGIDMGDGTVVHLAPSNGPRVTLRDDSARFTVRRDSLDEFCQGQQPIQIKHDCSLPAEQIAETAVNYIGKSGYSLLDGNCEHFASLCATGRSESHQIEMGQATLIAVGSAVTKAFWSASTRLGAKFAVRSATKLHPAALLADGVEIALLATSCRQGMSAERSQKLARVGGSLTAAGVGAVFGGPAGAALCVAAHTSSTAIADGFLRSARKLLG